MAKVLCVLYADPVDGYPNSYPRDDLPQLERYPDGQTLPTPKAIDFQPGALLGSVSGELGLRNYLESERPHARRHRRQGRARFRIRARARRCRDRHLPALLAGLSDAPSGSPKRRTSKWRSPPASAPTMSTSRRRWSAGVTVTEVTFCNSISVAEHVVMMILSLVRNYLPSHQVVLDGGWNIADCAARSYDVEGMHVGTVAAGRIGLAVLKRLKPFDMHLHYYDRHRLPAEVEQELGLHWHDSVEDMVGQCDVVTINCPLHPETENLFDAAMLARMKRGAYLVNTARGKIADRDAVAAALRSGQLAGYAGDVWFPQPAPQDHPWRTMPHHGMTPHISGTSLSAQARYAAGVREILECYFEGRPIRDEYLIVQGGQLAGVGAHSYSEGNATGGSEEAARFKG